MREEKRYFKDVVHCFSPLYLTADGARYYDGGMPLLSFHFQQDGACRTGMLRAHRIFFGEGERPVGATLPANELLHVIGMTLGT